MYHPADANFLAVLQGQLSPDVFCPLTESYLQDPRQRFFATEGIVLAPSTAQETACILRACAAALVPVIPYSGGTGLVGGQIGQDLPKPVILSTKRLANIRGIYPQENLLITESGVILADIHQQALSHRRLFPLSLAAEGSCRIGGNLATNAGGMNVLRYGNARDLCLGIEAVFPDGHIYNGLKRLRKDNTGYALDQLLIGSEGTLGVITAACLRLFPVPAQESCALFSVANPQAALDFLALLQEEIGNLITTYELISGQGLHFLQETMPEYVLPVTQIPSWSVLVEIGLPLGLSIEAIWEKIFTQAQHAGYCDDGVLPHSLAQEKALRAMREHIPEANKRIGAIASHDISVPLGDIPAFINEAIYIVKETGPFRVNCFGHMGDGNLHFNVFPPKHEKRETYDKFRPVLMEKIHDLVAHYGGSFSAEHGIGRLKVPDLLRYGDIGKLAEMRRIKKALDPAGIMNPGVLFPVVD